MKKGKIRKRLFPPPSKHYNPPLFMYGHFLFDCLMPDILSGYDQFDIIYRQNTLYETIGAFKPVYEEVFQCRLEEIAPYKYHRLDSNIKEFFTDQVQELSKRLLPSSVIQVQKYIFDRYNIQSSSARAYPKVLLIKRGEHKTRLDCSQQQTNSKAAPHMLNKRIRTHSINSSENTDENLLLFGTPAQGRETNHLEQLNDLLSEYFKDCFERVVLEDLSFSEQINYFRHAKLIVGCHGAGFANLLFSQKGTIMIEVKPQLLQWSDFYGICKELGMKYKCASEQLDVVGIIEKELQQLKKEILK